MNHKTVQLVLVTLSVILTACGSTSKTSKGTPEPSDSLVEIPVYHGSATKLFDLIHTKLEVSFDWEHCFMPGEAEITLKPHFYPQNKLILNARGMQINGVYKIAGSGQEEMPYEYKNDSLTIGLDKLYHSTDTLQVKIDYIARPNQLAKGGSKAITEDKGLYFINPDGKTKGKPREIWTQGETQASSAWFPTIDMPNQKSTEEIYITVDTNFVTLSNGLLISSVVNTQNGTRTDYWKMDLPHAPYLFMMAVGEFSVVKDFWRGKEVSYYVEPEFEKYARNIFGNTPEMLEFFSNKLGVDYAWDKYAQVVVRDYVSGAMENTTATVFGEFMQQDSRQQLDNLTEDVISHELFHHWFGDLVTCESWANITLNESFATYGEYLWNEHKYGKDFADYYLAEDLKSYLKEAATKQVDLVRFHYKSQEDVYDRHSYQKGGRILHMLRCYVGDDAFFASLKYYLNHNRFGTAEVQDLRLAFEQVTGEDLNWFFNEWYYDKGHPKLRISHSWNDSTGYSIRVEQLQNTTTTPVYTLPVDIDFYSSANVERKRIVITQKDQTFTFALNQQPLLVNFDSKKMLLCVKEEIKPAAQWVYQYYHAPRYLDRYEAMAYMGAADKPGSPQAEVLYDALNDPSPKIREIAIQRSAEIAKNNKEKIKNKLMQLAANDYDSGVRNAALEQLAENFDMEPAIDSLMLGAMKDSSYNVMFIGAEYTMKHHPEIGAAELKKMEHSESKEMDNLIGGLYAIYGGDRQFDFMSERLDSGAGDDRYYALQEYGKFLERCDSDKAIQGIARLSKYAGSEQEWTNRLSATLALESIEKGYGKADKDSSAIPMPGDKDVEMRREVLSSKVRNAAHDALKIIYSSEADPELRKIYDLRK
ncbi:MAG TPA: M1 family aminopeptidase [Bacteroidia bacterium]|nr:M1 family aminopeptidase [Bacteroidia bacterium]